MSQVKMKELVELMLDEGIEHFNKTEPVMELTENGYVDTGKVQKVWQAKDVAAFTALLKMLEYKHVDGISSSAEEMRKALGNKAARRAAKRQEQHAGLPPLTVVVNS